MFHAPKEYLAKHPLLGIGEGNNGFFIFKKNNIQFRCQASDGGGWEHVSVTLSVKRCPDWEEMCMIKNMFWDEDDGFETGKHMCQECLQESEQDKKIPEKDEDKNERAEA